MTKYAVFNLNQIKSLKHIHGFVVIYIKLCTYINLSTW